MMKLDCCFHGFRLFTPGNGSRKNIFSSDYRCSLRIICFSYASFNMRDLIPIFDALAVLAFSQWQYENGLSRPMFFQPRFGSSGGSLCIRGQKSFLPKFLHSYHESYQCLVTSRRGSLFAHCIMVNLQFRSRAPNLEYLPVFCCFLHLCH